MMLREEATANPEEKRIAAETAVPGVPPWSHSSTIGAHGHACELCPVAG